MDDTTVWLSGVELHLVAALVEARVEQLRAQRERIVADTILVPESMSGWQEALENTETMLRVYERINRRIGQALDTPTPGELVPA